MHRACDVGEPHRCPLLGAPREHPRWMQLRPDDEQAERGDDGQDAQRASYHEEVAAPVVTVGVDGEQRDHRRPHREAKDLDSDVAGRQPPLPSEVLEGCDDADGHADPGRGDGTEEQEPPGGHQLGAGAEHDEAAGVADEVRHQPQQCRRIVRKGVGEDADAHEGGGHPGDQDQPRHRPRRSGRPHPRKGALSSQVRLEGVHPMWSEDNHTPACGTSHENRRPATFPSGRCIRMFQSSEQHSGCRTQRG